MVKVFALGISCVPSLWQHRDIEGCPGSSVGRALGWVIRPMSLLSPIYLETIK